MNPSKGPRKPTAGFCAICSGHHDPDVPCFDQTQQALKYLDIPKNQQKRRMRNLNKWVKITAGIILFAPVIGMLWMAIVNLSRYLQK
jgi:hypothetical protein